MIVLSDTELINYPILLKFLKATEKLHALVLREPFKYQYHVNLVHHVDLDEEEIIARNLSAVEICALLGLDKQLNHLRKDKEYYHHICQEDNKAFYYCVENAHLKAFKQIEVVLTKEEFLETIQNENASLLKQVVNKAHFAFFKHFKNSLSDIDFIDLIEARNFDIFRLITSTQNIQFMNFLGEHLSTKELSKAIQVFNFEPYQVAAEKGSFEFIDFFEKQLSDVEVVHAIKAQSYDAYRKACRYGHLNLLEHFEARLSELDVLTAIKEHSFEDFCLAAENSHHDAINAIKARHFEAIRKTSKHGHLQVLKHITSKLSERELINAIEIRSYEAFRLAAENGHLQILQFWEAICVKLGIDIIDAIKADKYESFNFNAFRFDAFRAAAEHGHLTLLQHFEIKFLNSGIDICQAISAYSFESFRLAAENGHIKVLKHFESKLASAQINVKDAIKTNHYYAYQYSAANGHNDILKYLESFLEPSEIIEAISSRKYSAYCYSLRNGHLHTIKHIENKLEHTKITAPEIIKLDRFKAFKYAAFKNHVKVILHCLKFDAVFAHAEIRVADYATQFVKPFIRSYLNQLWKRSEEYEKKFPDKEFNIKNTEAQLFFYIIRHLIRSFSDENIEIIQQLIQLSSVKVLLHEDMNGDGENELLRLALRLGNTEAVKTLIQVPRIMELAEENNFYETVWGAYGALDLREIIAERHAFTQQISPDEQRMVDLFQERYKDQVKNEQETESILDPLLEQLTVVYKETPAVIYTEHKKEVKLPVLWEDYRKLTRSNKKTPDFSKMAINAYYDHTLHTVIRCLWQDKSWLSEKNKYLPEGLVFVEHWSTQEIYRPTLAHLYLAASERKTGKTGDDFFKQRLDLFLKLYTSLCGIEI